MVAGLLAAATGQITTTAAAAPAAPSWAPEGRAPNDHPRLESSLADDLAAGAPVTPASDEALDDGFVEVVVEAADGSAAAAVAAVDGRVTTELEGVVQAEVDPSRLGDLADRPGVDRVREPRPMIPAVQSQGVGTSGAAAWQGAGWGGTGVEVAIIDGGFVGYESRLGTELPATVETDFGRCGAQTSDHGTATAEIVHDMAPTALLRLVCIQTDIDFVSAAMTMAANEIDVVSVSLGFPLTNRGDGSGDGGGVTTPAEAVALLRRQGILVVVSAGNNGGLHHHRSAVGDADGPGFDDLVDMPGGDDVLTFRVTAGGVAQLAVQWDAWPLTTLDFDVYVGNDACGLMGFSELDQANGPAPPIEFLVFENDCGLGTQDFEVIVNRFNGAGAPRIDFTFNGDVLAVEAPTGSNVSDPATSAAVLTVGAHCHSNGVVQPYSSTGPTIDGRIKPDLSGPDATTSSVYGNGTTCSNGFTGTSASAPHVAGAAALLKGANPGLDVAELQQLLLDRAVDAGPAGPDNAYGVGRLALGAAGSAVTPTPQPFTPLSPVRLIDTRSGLTGIAETVDRQAKVGAGTPGILTLRVRGSGRPVPVDATAVVLNVTVTQPSAGSFVSVSPVGGVPRTSNLNFVAGQTVAQHVTATINPVDGAIRIYNHSGATHVIVDVSGWYGPTGAGNQPATNRFSTLPAPRRAFDSRAEGQGYAEATNRSAALSGGGTIALPLAGVPNGPPAGATAVIVNLTFVAPSQDAHLTVWPAGTALPNASSINAAAGQIVANLVVVPVSAQGRVNVRLNAGSAHVIIDTVGWFQPNVGAGYVAQDPPERLLDSRTGTGPRLGPLATGTYNQPTARYLGVPGDAEAVLFGVVAVSLTGGGFVTVWPAGQAQPLTSNINFGPGAVVPNAVISRLGSAGRVSFFNKFGLTHLVADVSGYFLDPADVPVPLSEPPAVP